MIKLFQPPGVWGLPSMSPFCVKLETYFKMTGLEYRVEAGNPMIAPKGKIPYVEIDGKRMGDSGLIIDYLKKTRGDPLDAALTAQQKAQAIAVQRMVEEHIYFCGGWLRWNDEESYRYVREVFLKILPPLIGPLLLKKFRKDFLSAIKAQGIGRHTRDEIVEFLRVDLAALSQLLGENDFFFGSSPTAIDAVLYGFLVQQLWVPWDGPGKQLAKSFPNFEPYCQRMKALYWA